MIKRQKEIDLFSEPEIYDLIGACSKRGPAGMRDRALIAVMAFAGLRVSEALSIRASQVKKERSERFRSYLAGKAKFESG